MKQYCYAIPEQAVQLQLRDNMEDNRLSDALRWAHIWDVRSLRAGPIEKHVENHDENILLNI